MEAKGAKVLVEGIPVICECEEGLICFSVKVGEQVRNHCYTLHQIIALNRQVDEIIDRRLRAENVVELPS